MQAPCACSESGTHDPVTTAGIAHSHLGRIHPFDDGHGRGARILMSLIPLRHGLPPAVIRNERRADQLATLRAADAGDLPAFVTFIARAAHETMCAMPADLAPAPTPRE